MAASPDSIGSRYRAREWFYSKITVVIAIFFSAVLLLGIRPKQAIVSVALTLLAICSCGAFGYVINDLFDVVEDDAAGKPNKMRGLTRARRIAFLCLPILFGFLPLLILSVPLQAKIVLALDYLLAAAYSAPPIRLKVRGLLGNVTDATAVHALPALFSILVLPGAWDQITKNLQLFACSVFLWSFFYGLRGIFLHQIWDFENDTKSGFRSFVITIGKERVRRLIQCFLFPMEAAGFIGLCYFLIPRSLVFAISLGIYFLGDILKWKIWKRPFDVAPKQLGNYVPPADFYQAWFGLAIVLQLCLTNILFVPLLCLYVFSFYPEIKARVAENWHLLRDVFRYIGTDFLRLKKVA